MESLLVLINCVNVRLKISPTARTLKYFRDKDYTIQVCERWCSFSHRRIDLFGVIDLVSLANNKIIGIQACAGSSFSARYKKILDEPKAKKWVECGGELHLMAWRKIHPIKGKKRMIWEPRIHVFTLEDWNKSAVVTEEIEDVG